VDLLSDLACTCSMTTWSSCPVAAGGTRVLAVAYDLKVFFDGDVATNPVGKTPKRRTYHR